MAQPPIITSPPGFSVLTARVANGKCEAVLIPVIAWQCGVTPINSSATDEDTFFLYSFPVIPNCAPIEDEHERTHFIVFPDGRVSDGSRVKFADIEEAKKFLVTEYKRKSQK